VPGPLQGPSEPVPHDRILRPAGDDGPPRLDRFFVSSRRFVRQGEVGQLLRIAGSEPRRLVPRGERPGRIPRLQTHGAEIGPRGGARPIQLHRALEQRARSFELPRLRRRVSGVDEIGDVPRLVLERRAVLHARLAPAAGAAEHSGEVVVRVAELRPHLDRVPVGALRLRVVVRPLGGGAVVEPGPDVVGVQAHGRRPDGAIVRPVAVTPGAAHDTRRDHDGEHRDDEPAPPGSRVRLRRGVRQAPEQAETGRRQVEEPLRQDGADRHQEIRHRQERQRQQEQRECRRRTPPPVVRDTQGDQKRRPRSQTGARVEERRRLGDRDVGVVDRQVPRPDQEHDVAPERRQGGEQGSRPRQVGDRIVDEMGEGLRRDRPEDERPDRQAHDEHAERQAVEAQRGARLRPQPVRGQEQERRGDAALLREHRQRHEEQRSDTRAVEEELERPEREQRHEQLAAPDDEAERLGVNRVCREQQRRRHRRGDGRARARAGARVRDAIRTRRGDDAPRHAVNEPGDQHVQQQVDDAEPEGARAGRQPVQRERQDGHRPVEIRDLAVVHGPVAARQDLGQAPGLLHQAVLLD